MSVRFMGVKDVCGCEVRVFVGASVRVLAERIN